MFMGDLAARFSFASLLYLVNGTQSANGVADGFPMHKSVACWSASSMRKGGYDFAGWGHIRRASECHARFYGRRAGTLDNLTLNHPPGSKAWCATERTVTLLSLV